MRHRLTLALALPAMLVGLASCSDDDDPPDGAAPTASTTSDGERRTTVDEPVATSTTLTPFPAENTELSHGGDTWAVVLAAVQQPTRNVEDDPAAVAAEQVARSAGYSTGATDCDAGAPEALGLDDGPEVYTISVYLRTEADAQQALRAFRERGFTGGAVAQLQTFCMD